MNSTHENEVASLLKLSDHRDFLTAAYRMILRREPDITGFDHYLHLLASGSPRQQVLNDIAKSREAIQRETIGNARKAGALVKLRNSIFQLLKIDQRRQPNSATLQDSRGDKETSNRDAARVTTRGGLFLKGLTRSKDNGLFNGVLFWNFQTYPDADNIQIQTGFGKDAKTFATGGKFGAEPIHGWLRPGTCFFALSEPNKVLLDVLFITEHDLPTPPPQQGEAKLLPPVQSSAQDRTYDQRPEICKLFRINNLSQLSIDAAIETIAFPATQNPLVSVIIPTYGRPDLCLACLFSISKNMPSVDIEILLVEDASSDKQIQKLASIPGLRFIRHAKNLGFTLSCNEAAKQAQGQFLHFLNNDTEVRPGWLDSLIESFSDLEDAGMVGSKLIYPDGRLQEAGGIVWGNGNAWNFGRMQDPLAPEFSYRREVDYCSAASVLIPRSLFEQVGGFDEKYAPAYCEDTDLAFKVRSAGKKVYFIPSSVVIHYEGQSHGRDEKVGLKAYQVRNQRYFAKKWATILATHYSESSHLSLARERLFPETRRLFLIFDHYIPQADRDAGSRTMLQIIELLASEGYSVKFVPQNFWYDPLYAEDLQKRGIEIFYGPSAPQALETLLGDASKEVAGALFSRPEVAAHFFPLLKRFKIEPIFYYGHDVHHLRLAMEAGQVIDSEKVLQASSTYKEVEQRIWRDANVVLYPSNLETRYAEQWAKANGLTTAFRTLPVFAYKDFDFSERVSFHSRDRIVFVGGFRHRPNVQAVEWLIREVVPFLRKAARTKTLYIIGSHPPEEILALAGERVVVTGHVSDSELRRHYSLACCAVAPLRFGAGMKGKVVEALRYQVPVVTTSVGAQGLEAASSFLPSADDPRAFADQISQLCEDARLSMEREQRGLAFVMEHFSTAALRQCFTPSLEATTKCTY